MTEPGDSQSDAVLHELLARLADDEEDVQSREQTVISSTDSTLFGLRQELAALESEVRTPAESNPFEKEQTCAEAIRRIEQYGQEPSFAPKRAGGPGIDGVRTELGVNEIGQYRLLEKLGQGGMGTVYKAFDTRLEKVVAIKLLRADQLHQPESVSRFEREMRAVGKLDHPNTVGALDANVHEQTHYIVTEYVRGQDLSKLLRTNGRLPIADACELVRQAALGLQHASEQGLVHRDIKPSNLILAETSDGPRVKILDMGLALLANAKTKSEDLTSIGQVMGTLDYLAPEQASDSHSVDVRADIYSLGATLYRLLSGFAPYSGHRFDSPLKKLHAIANEEISPVSSHRANIPPDLAALIDRMLSRDPSKRPKTPREVATAIGVFARDHRLGALLGCPEFSREDTNDYPETHTIEPTQAEASRAAGQTFLASTIDQDPDKSRNAIRSSGRVFRKRAFLSGTGILLLGLILVFATAEGQVEVNSPPGSLPDDISISVIDEEGQTVLRLTSKDKWQATISGGHYRVALTGRTSDHFELTEKTFSVSRFEKAVLTVRKVEPRVPQPERPIDRRLAAEILKLGGGKVHFHVGEQLYQYHSD